MRPKNIYFYFVSYTWNLSDSVDTEGLQTGLSGKEEAGREH